uniref:(California timema) hypothetical protein n=1 Tax=Timema californicum TaxID=61474 RepID=A0A7R9J2M8_TIMCA|nr:unnamed protein product [Timema californicum]
MLIGRESWQVLDVNVKGLSIFTREALKSMKERGVNDGHIIHLNSIAGQYLPGSTSASMYPASKHAVTVLTEGLRRELVQLGSKIKVTKLAASLKSAPGKLYALKADVTKEEEILAAFAWIKKNLGGVDILINNAGVGTGEPLSDIGRESWQVLDVNVKGLSIFTREALKSMKERGVNDGHIIHLNSVSPGVVETEFANIYGPEMKKFLYKENPVLQAKDIADAVLYTLGTPPHVQVIALVTGASVGIGAAIVEELVKHGLKVVGLARRVDKKLAASLKSAPGKLYAVKADVTKEEEILAAFDWIKKNLGGVDILINNAGVGTVLTRSLFVLQAKDIADAVLYTLGTPPHVQIHEITIKPIGEKIVGIGAAIAQELVKHGLKVVGLARRVEKVEELAAVLKNAPGKLYAVKADIAKEEEILAAFDWIKKNLGGVDILINNAGVGSAEVLSNVGDISWRVLDVNVKGLSIFTREALKSMKERGVNDGHIIHINSAVGHYLPSGRPVTMYAASKHAVIVLTEGLRRELVQLGSKTKVTKFLYEGNAVLQAKDIADAVIYTLGTPPHVQLFPPVQYIFN